MRFKILLLASYFLAAPLVVLITIFTSLYFFHQENPKVKATFSINSVSPYYEALPVQRAYLEQKAIGADARVVVLKEFFEKHNSPLTSHTEKFVEVADKHRLDYRLLPAIAMQESNLCKKIPTNSYNCWGFGIYGDNVIRFANYDEAIEAVAKGLSKNYISQGLTEPEQIMTKYTPGSDGSWAESVNFFMDSIQSSL